MPRRAGTHRGWSAGQTGRWAESHWWVPGESLDPPDLSGKRLVPWRTLLRCVSTAVAGAVMRCRRRGVPVSHFACPSPVTHAQHRERRWGKRRSLAQRKRQAGWGSLPLSHLALWAHRWTPGSPPPHSLSAPPPPPADFPLSQRCPGPFAAQLMGVAGEGSCLVRPCCCCGIWPGAPPPCAGTSSPPGWVPETCWSCALCTAGAARQLGVGGSRVCPAGAPLPSHPAATTAGPTPGGECTVAPALQ